MRLTPIRTGPHRHDHQRRRLRRARIHGDTVGSDALPHWYRPHIASWSAAAGPATTLWFWNTELGWASVHPVLAEYGWEYVQLIVWDKGLAHIAGNVNGRTIRQFPVVTEVCAFYQRTFTITGPGGPMPPKQWVRHEWARSGLSLQKANQACGVKNAATRKYLTKDWLWYWPPGEMTERLAAYANAHGLRPAGLITRSTASGPSPPPNGTPCGTAGGTRTA